MILLIIGLIMLVSGIGIGIGLFVTWVQNPDLTWMQYFLKYLFYHILELVLIFVGKIFAEIGK